MNDDQMKNERDKGWQNQQQLVNAQKRARENAQIAFILSWNKCPANDAD